MPLNFYNGKYLYLNNTENGIIVESHKEPIEGEDLVPCTKEEADHISSMIAQIYMIYTEIKYSRK